MPEVAPFPATWLSGDGYRASRTRRRVASRSTRWRHRAQHRNM